MKKHFRNILTAIFLTLAMFCYPGVSYAVDCPGAKTTSQANVGDPTKPDGSGVFDSQILEQMQGLMVGVYKTLSQISMFGHSLVCYAQTPKLGAYELKLISWDILNVAPTIVIWDFSMLLCGVFVYIVGILTSYAIGMYFIDISFKIGFAVLFFPVTIALWPFKPTTQKFMDNLFIVIRNSMLFAMVAITVAFSTELIAQGLQLDEYWALVDMGVAQAGQVKQMYSLSTTKFLVIAFVLIFSFKILSASVEKFLDFFFNDPAFGSESPMHKMGTQAVGMAWQLTGAQALSYAGDVAMNMTGKAMIATGNSLDRMSKGDFSDIKKLGRAAKSAGSAVIHPIRTTRRAAQATRRAASSAANSALSAAGTVAKDLHDFKSLFKVGDFYEEEYREKQASFNSRVDNFTSGGVRNAAKQTVSAGLAKATNATGILLDTAKAPFQSGSVADRAARTFSALKGEQTQRISTNEVRQALHEAKQEASQLASDAGAAIKQAAPDIAKTAAAASVAAASKVAAAAGLMDPAQAMTTQQARAALHSGKQRAEAFVQSAKDNIQMAGQLASTAGKIATTYVDQHTQGLQKAATATADWTKDAAKSVAAGVDPDKTSISITPSTLISAPFRLAGGVGNTIATLAKLQVKGLDILDPNREQKMQQIWQQSDLYKAGKKVADSATSFSDQVSASYSGTSGSTAKKVVVGGFTAGKVVVNKGGQIILRSARGTTQDTVGVLSKVFVGFGKELTNRGRGKSGWEKWKEKEEETRRKEIDEQEERLRNQSLADKYDN